MIMTPPDTPGKTTSRKVRQSHRNLAVDTICRACNNNWLAGIESKVAPILTPMAITRQPTLLNATDQALLSFWAIKTGLLLELALRQQHPGQRTIEGYAATPQELAWLRHKNEPPPRSMVWLGCWDCQQATPVNYEPSGAELPGEDGTPVAGHLTTFTLGYAAFQIFTVDFITAQLHTAPVWNPRPPTPLREARRHSPKTTGTASSPGTASSDPTNNEARLVNDPSLTHPTVSGIAILCLRLLPALHADRHLG
jgi:hypothetical protein